MRIRFAALTVGILLVATACSSGLDGSWHVTEMAQPDGTMAAPMSGTDLTLTFTDDRVSGSAGCNTFMASGDWPSGSIRFATTLMACEPDIMQQESTHLALLAAADSASIDNETMTVTDADGRVVLLLVQSPK